MELTVRIKAEVDNSSWGEISEGFQGVFDKLQAELEKIKEITNKQVDEFVQGTTKDVSETWDKTQTSLKTITKNALGGSVVALFKGDMDQVENIWDAAWDSMIGKSDALWDGFLNRSIDRAFNGLSDIFEKAVWDPATDWLSDWLGFSGVSFSEKLSDFASALEMGDTIGEALHAADITSIFYDGGALAGLGTSLAAGAKTVAEWFGLGNLWGPTAAELELLGVGLPTSMAGGVAAGAGESALLSYGGTYAGGEFAGTYGSSALGTGGSALAGIGSIAAVYEGGLMLANMLGTQGSAPHLWEIPGTIWEGISGGGEGMTPEKAMANWFGGGGSDGQGQGWQAFIEKMTANMQGLGQTFDSLGMMGSNFEEFGESAQEAAKALEHLTNTGAMTQEQVDAMVASLNPLAQEFVASGEAANLLEGEVSQLVEQMSAASNSYAMTTTATREYNQQIDDLAARLGLTGAAAEEFRAAIWGLSEGFSHGGAEAAAFASSLDRFVSGTLGSVTAGAEGGAEAIRSLIDSMRGVSGASSGIVARALGKGETSLTFVDTARSGGVDGLGLYSGGGGGIDDLGIGSFHQGGLVRGWPRAHAGALISSLARDEVPIVARRGEYVVRAESVTAASLPALKALNQGGAAPGGDMTVNFAININGNVMGNDDQIEDMVRLIESRLRRLQSSRWGG